MQTAPAIAPTSSSVATRPLTIRDYECLIAGGCFDPEERIELLNGQLMQMSPKGTRHSAAVTRIDRLLRKALGDTILVRLQDPIVLDDNSEPEPDLAIVRPHSLDYANRHPNPEDIYWLIEVADTSLVYDTEVKANAYARNGISDYWVVDLMGGLLWAFRNPSETGYGIVMQLDRQQTLAPVPFPDRQFAVADFLGPEL